MYDSKLKNVTFTFDPNPRPQQPMATLDEMVVSLDFYAAQIKFDGRDYSLEQVEFRTKSGHQIDSKEYGIEMDLVFRSRAQRQEVWSTSPFFLDSNFTLPSRDPGLLLYFPFQSRKKNLSIFFLLREICISVSLTVRLDIRSRRAEC